MAASWVGLALMAMASAAQYENTQHTAARQDQQAAASILNQSRIQRQADAKVGAEVQKLQGSNSSDAAATRLDDYMNVLRENRSRTNGGLAPNIGSNTFRADSADAATGVQDYATKTAGLLSRIDAPQIQRQGEAFGYGNLGTDLGLIARQSQGQSFIDQLRQNAIRRNAKIDLASSLLASGAGAAYGSGSGAMAKAAAGGTGYGISGAGNAGMYAGYA